MLRINVCVSALSTAHEVVLYDLAHEVTMHFLFREGIGVV